MCVCVCVHTEYGVLRTRRLFTVRIVSLVWCCCLFFFFYQNGILFLVLWIISMNRFSLFFFIIINTKICWRWIGFFLIRFFFPPCVRAEVLFVRSRYNILSDVILRYSIHSLDIEYHLCNDNDKNKIEYIIRLWLQVRPHKTTQTNRSIGFRLDLNLIRSDPIRFHLICFDWITLRFKLVLV